MTRPALQKMNLDRAQISAALKNNGMKTTGWTDEHGSHKWVIAVEWVRGRGLEDWRATADGSLAGIGRKTTGVRDKDGGGRAVEDDGWPRPRGPESESVYRLCFINSRAVSKSPRSAESLWIGAKKIHLPTMSLLWCRRQDWLWLMKWFFSSIRRGNAGVTLPPRLLFKKKKKSDSTCYMKVSNVLFFLLQGTNVVKRVGKRLRDKCKGYAADVELFADRTEASRRTTTHKHKHTHMHTQQVRVRSRVQFVWRTKPNTSLHWTWKRNRQWHDEMVGACPGAGRDVVQSQSKLQTFQRPIEINAWVTHGC